MTITLEQRREWQRKGAQAKVEQAATRKVRASAIRRFTLELSWPVSELMQNRSDGHHWTFAADAKANYRREGYLSTLSAINESSFDARERDNYRVVMVFDAPDNRRRDVSNLHAAMKSALDGIAAAMGVDDSHFVEHTQRKGGVVERGRVSITVERMG